MRERIDIAEAVRLYQTWRSWREVAKRLLRRDGTRFRTDSIWLAVRRHDLGLPE